MFVMVAIDSEDYSDLSYSICSLKEEAESYFYVDLNERLNGKMLDELQFETKDDWHGASLDDWFEVGQIIKVDDKPYILVHWHAYEGIDFDAVSFDTKEEAEAEMKARVEELRESLAETEIEWEKEDGVCVDTMTEWEIWKIVEGR